MALSLRSRSRGGFHASVFTFDIVLKVLVSAIKAKKKKKREGRRKGREEEKENAVFIDDMIMYPETPKKSTRKLL
jgi:hypothetical protein